MPDLTREEIERMVREKVAESLVLDYKRSPSLAREGKAPAELAKDVSAFANSDGGSLIYGVIEQNTLPVDFDEGIDPERMTREWVLDTLQGNIRPRLEGLNAYPVDHPRERSHVLYVIEVPKGRTAHMANHSYYKRFELQSVAMDDYEVRDVMRRSEAPDVRLRLRSHPDPLVTEFFLEIRNFSATPAPYFALSLLFGPGVSLPRIARGTIFNAASVKFGGKPRVVLVEGQAEKYHEWRYEWWNRIPLFEADWEELALLALSVPPGGTVLWLTEGPGMRNRGAYRVRANVVPFRFGVAEIAWDFSDRDDGT